MTLIELDQFVFHLINHEWTHPVFDAVLPVWRNKYFWIPVYVFIIGYTFHNFGKKGYWLLLFLILSAGTADVISSELIKKNVERIRPCNDTNIQEVRSLVRCGSGYSFTSSHATNHFAVSFFLIGTLAMGRRKVKWCLFAWACTIAYAQVYVGVHYPIDVIAGAILGVLIAKFFVWFYRSSGLDVRSLGA